MTTRTDDDRFMARAIALAACGEGAVEPNPMVGCVIVRNGEIVGEGFHEAFGGSHAEVIALERAGERSAGATAYVTLEPCCHHGKTPPCTQALIGAGVARVVAALEDPFPQVAGGGIGELKTAGVHCDVGVRRDEAAWLLAPYRKLLATRRPWIIAKWAMTLDGKMAARTGDSQWISNETSRSVVHQLRGRVDAILVGSRTAQLDNPMLTARPADHGDLKRMATRIVFDSSATLALDSRLAKTARDVPVLVAVAEDTPEDACARLSQVGAEILRCPGVRHVDRLNSLLDELGRRRTTNVLVEGGSRLLGALFEMQAVDEVHVFVAPKIAGGEAALSPVGGMGIDRMRDALPLREIAIEELAGDIYIHGRLTA